MSAHDYDALYRKLTFEGSNLLAQLETHAVPALQALANETSGPHHSWIDRFYESPEDAEELDAVARAYAHKKPTPKLSSAQYARLALRMCLGSRLLTLLDNTDTKQEPTFSPPNLQNLSESEIVEWILVDAVPVCLGFFHESIDLFVALGILPDFSAQSHEPLSAMFSDGQIAFAC